MTTGPIEVHPIEVRGQTYTVHLDQNGTFRAYDDAGIEAATSDTRQGLLETLTKATRRASGAVSVPITVLVNGQPRHGEATGIHATNHNILVRWADGERGRISMIRDRELLGGMTEEEGQTWLRLIEAVNAAGRDIYAFREAHKIDLHAELRAAMRLQATAAE